MKNKTQIGIGVVLLAGVGYYFYNKSKSSMTNISNAIVEETKISGFDREKLAKDFAGFAFPIINKAQSGKTPMQGFAKDSNGNYTVVKANVPMSELTLYKSTLAMLNGISDDSDALFTLNEVKKLYSSGDDRNYKPDLDTQIRLEKIQLKYPDALNQMGIGS
jgi:hypothetical protein